MSIGVPIKVLHEAEGHIVTCETNTGEVYRGKLIEAEDNMNCQVSLVPHKNIPLFAAVLFSTVLYFKKKKQHKVHLEILQSPRVSLWTLLAVD